VAFATKEKEMKAFFRSIGIAGGILVLAGVQNASAQITNLVEFTTAFGFTVGNATVPAGSYAIRPDDDAPNILIMTGAHGDVIFQTENKNQKSIPSKTEVLFNRYGDGYVLKGIQVEGSETGYVTIPVEGERHVTKRGASNGEQRVAARKRADTSN
jgi:hypothetical protein